MDVLSIRTDGLYFHQGDVRHMRDLCLLSIIQGEVAHFPDALLGTCVGLLFPCTYPITETISRCLVLHVAGEDNATSTPCLLCAADFADLVLSSGLFRLELCLWL